MILNTMCLKITGNKADLNQLFILLAKYEHEQSSSSNIPPSPPHSPPNTHTAASLVIRTPSLCLPSVIFPAAILSFHSQVKVVVDIRFNIYLKLKMHIKKIWYKNEGLLYRDSTIWFISYKKYMKVKVYMKLNTYTLTKNILYKWRLTI